MSFPKESTSFILNEPPLKEVNYNLQDEHSTFKLVKRPLRQLKDDEVLVRTLYLSNDPTQRAWIQKGLQADRMYVSPVLKGEVMRSGGLGQVVQSNLSQYKPGDIVSCELTWSDYAILNSKSVFYKITDTSVPLTWHLDVLGLTGFTAYFGLLKIAQLKATDVVVISAASGATGSMCVQIAKNVIGCKKVIGISGGPEKCRYVESLGADACIDYTDPKYYFKLKKALGEDKYADVFFDGVGGRTLDVMLTLVRPFGTIIACGAIVGYNDVKKSAIIGWPQIITNRLKVFGFIVFDHFEEFGNASKDLLRWISEGKIKVSDSSYTLVDCKNEFQKIPETWGILFSPKKGPGKLLTKVSDAKL